jgi:hypothetical protein
LVHNKNDVNNDFGKNDVTPITTDYINNREKYFVSLKLTLLAQEEKIRYMKTVLNQTQSCEETCE